MNWALKVFLITYRYDLTESCYILYIYVHVYTSRSIRFSLSFSLQTLVYLDIFVKSSVSGCLAFCLIFDNLSLALLIKALLLEKACTYIGIWQFTKNMRSRFSYLSPQRQSPEVLCKKGVLKIFVKFTRNHLCRSLYSTLPHRCFSLNFATFNDTHSEKLVLYWI